MIGAETIFAVASGFGRAAIAVVRLSGPRSHYALSAMLDSRVPAPRRASLRSLVDPVSGETLDRALVLWMPGPATFTGEDQAELHIHGGPAVKAAVLRVLGALHGCRAAEPGEFTRRAFLNGRLDLTAVEGIADLVEAETEAQRRQALRQLEGVLAAEVAAWRDRLVDALAACEAALDFADEEDVPVDVAGGVGDDLAHLRRDIVAALAASAWGERVRDGFVVVIAGPPNAGKSTLLNAIARRDVAIVSPEPGTTRDAIEVRCDLGGLPVVFVDTAGLRESAEALERAGMARTLQRLASADLVLWLAPVGEEPAGNVPPGAFRIGTKQDLVGSGPSGIHDLALSAATGVGIDALLAGIRDRLGDPQQGAADAVVTRERHRVALREVAAALDRAALAWRSGAVELVAEDVRLALRALGRITGQVDVEEILDRIFASFCIGK